MRSEVDVSPLVSLHFARSTVHLLLSVVCLSHFVFAFFPHSPSHALSFDMPNGINPHEAVALDYTTGRFETTRLPLVNAFNITHDKAVNCLADIWVAQNELDKQDWDRQVADDAQAQHEAQEQQRIENEERRLAELEEQENARKEELKKNRNKFVPFPDTLIPSAALIIPSSLATHKLRKGEFCKLFFFTNKGLAEAETSSHSIDDEALSIIQDENGLHSFIPVSAACSKISVINDDELSWPQFDEAAHRMLKAMRENGWDDQRVNAHLQFWMALSSHAWRHGADKISKRALLIYQAHVHRRWHDTLRSTKAFNLHHLNAELLTNIRNELVHKAAITQIRQMKTVRTPCHRRSHQPLTVASPPLVFPSTPPPFP